LNKDHHHNNNSFNIKIDNNYINININIIFHIMKSMKKHLIKIIMKDSNKQKLIIFHNRIIKLIKIRKDININIKFKNVKINKIKLKNIKMEIIHK
jgi:hypothetical protein